MVAGDSSAAGVVDQIRDGASRSRTYNFWTGWRVSLQTVGHASCQGRSTLILLVTPIHLAADSSAIVIQHTNRLAGEKSPYLLQHAHNAVDWYPWGEEAFAKARTENKPIFLSIGYSTCHWCHVMAHESFESEEIAAVMNREFVNIKVDREERPDVDRVYMTFVQATTGSGGWPMSVWLTPNLQPFVGGTYFPPTDQGGRPGFKSVLEKIAAAWKQDHEKIVQQGSRIVDALRQAQGAAAPEGKMGPGALDQAYDQMAQTFDAKEGGFGTAPKFPRPVIFNFLTRFYARAPQSEKGKHALEMDLFTLRKMAAGGMHDHLGGGFHRYSVDQYWHVPHFEKMLYDQAQLAGAFLDAFQITRDADLETTARDVLDYVARDMTAKEGGFFSAEDADSLLQKGKPEHAEGAFYVWTEKEIKNALGYSAGIFNFHYGVEPDGNALAQSDPQGEFRGKNILIQRHAIAETAKQFKKSEDNVRQLLAEARKKLSGLRDKRPRPHLDDKIITAWNGLMISAFARGGAVLDDPHYVERAARAAQFVRANLWDEKNQTLYRSFRGGRSRVEGFADDYAFLIQGLLDLYEASFQVKWLKFAVTLQEVQDKLFLDEKEGGYFSTTGRDKSVVLRMKDDNDGAEPAASSVAALNLLRLAQIRGSAEFRELAASTVGAFQAILSRYPSAMPQMLVALDYQSGRERQIVIAGKPDAPDTRALLSEVSRHFLPNKIVLLADGAEGQRYLEQKLEAISDMSMIKGKAAAYVCENFTCQAPVTEPDALARLLSVR